VLVLVLVLVRVNVGRDPGAAPETKTQYDLPVRLSLIFVVLAGCSSDPIEIIQLPDEGQTFVLSVDETALWIGSDALPVKLGAATKLELALYDQTMDELGLTPGTMVPGSCESCALLHPRAVFTREPAIGGTWVSRSTEGAPLIDRLVPSSYPRCACSNFQAALVEIPVARQITVVAALREENGSVLIVVHDGSIARIKPDRSTERICSASRFTSSATLGMPGKLWLGRAAALETLVLADQSPDAPCSVASSTTTDFLSKRIRAMDADEQRLIGITATGRVFSFDGAFKTLSTELPPYERPSVIISGPQTAFVTNELADSVLWIDGTTTHLEVIVASNTLTDLAVSPILGPIAALRDTGFAVRENDHWKMLTVPGWIGPSAVVPFDGRLMTLARRGVPIELAADLAACPPLPAFSAERVYFAAPLGDDAIVLGDIISDENRTSAVGVLTSVPWCR